MEGGREGCNSSSSRSSSSSIVAAVALEVVVGLFSIACNLRCQA